jgi:hypothetical protein
MKPSLFHALEKIANGPAIIPAVFAGQLAAKGYAERAGSSGKRGYSFVRITPEGTSYLRQMPDDT